MISITCGSGIIQISAELVRRALTSSLLPAPTGPAAKLRLPGSYLAEQARPLNTTECQARSLPAGGERSGRSLIQIRIQLSDSASSAVGGS